MAGKTRRWLPVIAFAVVALTLPATPVQAADHEAPQSLLNRYQAQAGPGAAVHAGDADEAWTLTSGTATLFPTRPITEDDHFRIASQSKTFTAAVVLQLVDEGAVDLDAPIGAYLPGVVDGDGYDEDAISVRQILQHTAGLPRDAQNPAAEPDGSFTLAELVRSGLTQPPLYAPGEGWTYSNIGYLIAGMLIEEVTGQAVGAAVTERIIVPLGLAETSFPAPGDNSLASPYLPGYQGFWVGPVGFWTEVTFSFEMSRASSAGAVNSTLGDLTEFYRALAAGEVVSEESLAQMRTTVDAPALGVDYGLGLFKLDLSCGGEAWGHAGNLTTGHSSVTMTTDDGRFASLVTNAFPANENPPTRYEVVDAALCEESA
ncbi:serine hydrolase domain-containing protein [Glycomyces sp. NPDC046736]|uniref:serine hydrolase domain-containing protein n=1 Tax=Glycomyces sp. NPDC046736 TaxID=3155615 RepID=UPI0033C21584